MEVSGIPAPVLRMRALGPAAWVPSQGAPDQTPKEAAPAAQTARNVEGEPKPPAPETFAEATGIRLHVDAETNRIVAQIVDENNEVVRQVPPEDALRIAAMTRELMGLLFDQSA